MKKPVLVSIFIVMVFAGLVLFASLFLDFSKNQRRTRPDPSFSSPILITTKSATPKEINLEDAGEGSSTGAVGSEDSNEPAEATSPSEASTSSETFSEIDLFQDTSDSQNNPEN